MPGLPES